MACNDMNRLNQYVDGADGNFTCNVATLSRIIATECNNQHDCRQLCCGDLLRKFMYGDASKRIRGCHHDLEFKQELQNLAQNTGPDGAEGARGIENLYNTCKRIQQPTDPLEYDEMRGDWPSGYGYPRDLSEVTTPRCEATPNLIQNSDRAGGMTAWSVGQTETVTCNPGFQGGGVYTCTSSGNFEGGRPCRAITPRCEVNSNAPIVRNSDRADGMTALSVGQTETVTCNPGFLGGGVYTCTSNGFEGPGNTGIIGNPCRRACPPTEVPNSDKSATGSLTGDTRASFWVTCDDGAFGGGTWRCEEDSPGGPATFKGNPCTVGDSATDCHFPPCADKMRTEADDDYNFDCGDDEVYCGENEDSQVGSATCSTNRHAVSVDIETAAPDLEHCPVGYTGSYYSQRASVMVNGFPVEVPWGPPGIILKCQRRDGWSCGQPCGPDNLYNDTCPGQPGNPHP